MKKTMVCVLSAAMLAGVLAGPVAGAEAGEKAKDIETVTVSVEDLVKSADDGKYLTSPTDGVATGTIDAELITKKESNYEDFTSPKTPTLTKNRKKIFKKAFKEFVGSNVTPVAYLGKKTAEGTDYLYLATIKAVVPKAKEYYCLVTVNKDAEGKYSVADINNTEIETGINNLPGGWFTASEVKVSKTVKKAFGKATKGLLGVDYKPVAVLANQVVAGMNYCILCESKVVYPGAETELTLVYMYRGLDGGAEIMDIKKFAKNLKEELTLPESDEPEHSMRTLIVSVAEDASKDKLNAIFEGLGLSILYDYTNFNMYTVTLAEDTDEKGLNSLIEKLKAYDEILNVEKDYIMHTMDKQTGIGISGK